MDTNSSLDQVVQALLLEIKTLKAEDKVLKETLDKTDARLQRLCVGTENDSDRLHRRIDSVERDFRCTERFINNRFYR